MSILSSFIPLYLLTESLSFKYLYDSHQQIFLWHIYAQTYTYYSWAFLALKVSLITVVLGIEVGALFFCFLFLFPEVNSMVLPLLNTCCYPTEKAALEFSPTYIVILVSKSGLLTPVLLCKFMLSVAHEWYQSACFHPVPNEVWTIDIIIGTKIIGYLETS